VDYYSAKTPEDFSLELFLDVAKTQDSVPVSNVNKAIDGDDLEYFESRKTFSYKFDFYNQSDCSNQLKISDLDGLVYTRVRGMVLARDQLVRFEFPIRNYHELVRYTIQISEEKSRLAVRVVDSDFDLKNAMFNPLNT
jgi:hypothetical protein